MTISWSQLNYSERQKARQKGLVNGIGATDTVRLTKFLRLIQPKWLSHASGDYHDWEYILGGDEIDRYRADLYFHLLILQDARLLEPSYIVFLWRYLRAKVYYLAVRFFGYKRFHYRADRLSPLEVFKILYPNGTDKDFHTWYTKKNVV